MEFQPYLLVLGLTQAVYGHFMHPVLLHPLARKFRFHPLLGVPHGPIIHPFVRRPILGPVGPFLPGPVVPLRPFAMVHPHVLHKAAMHMEGKRIFWENIKAALNRQRLQSPLGTNFDGNTPTYYYPASIPNGAIDNPKGLEQSGSVATYANTESVTTRSRSMGKPLTLSTAPGGLSAKTKGTQEKGTGISQGQYKSRIGHVPLSGGFPTDMQVEGMQGSNQAGITGGNMVVRTSVVDNGLSSGLHSANNGGSVSYEQHAQDKYLTGRKSVGTQVSHQQETNNGKLSQTPIKNSAYLDKSKVMSQGYDQHQTISATHKPSTTVVTDSGYHDTSYGISQTSGQQQTNSGSTSTFEQPTQTALKVRYESANPSGSKVSSPMYEQLSPMYQEANLLSGQTSGQQPATGATTLYEQGSSLSSQGYQEVFPSGRQNSGSQETYGASTSAVYDKPARRLSKQSFQEANHVNNQASGQQDPSGKAVKFGQTVNQQSLLTGNEPYGQNQGIYAEYQSNTVGTNGQQTDGTTTSVANSMTGASYSQRTQDPNTASGSGTTYESQFTNVGQSKQTPYDQNGLGGTEAGYQTQVGYQDSQSSRTSGNMQQSYSGNPLQDQYMQGSHMTPDVAGPTRQPLLQDTLGTQDPYYFNEPITGGNPNARNLNDIYGTTNSVPTEGKTMSSFNSGTAFNGQDLAPSSIHVSNQKSHTDITYSKTSATNQNMGTVSDVPYKTHQNEMLNDFSNPPLTPSATSGKVTSGHPALTDIYILESPLHKPVTDIPADTPPHSTNSTTNKVTASTTKTTTKSLDSTPSSGVPQTTREGFVVFEPLQRNSGPYSQVGHSPTFPDAAVPTIITDNTVPAGTIPQTTSTGNVNSNYPGNILSPAIINPNSLSNTYQSSRPLEHGGSGSEGTANSYSGTGNGNKNTHKLTSVTDNMVNVHSSAMSSASTKSVKKSQIQLDSNVKGQSASSHQQKGISVYTDVKTEIIKPVQNTAKTKQKLSYDSAQQGQSSSANTVTTQNTISDSAYSAGSNSGNTGLAADKVLNIRGDSTYTAVSNNGNTGLVADKVLNTRGDSTYTAVSNNGNTGRAADKALNTRSDFTYTGVSNNGNSGFATDVALNTWSVSSAVSSNGNTGLVHNAAAETSGSTYTDMPQNQATQQGMSRLTHDGMLHNANAQQQTMAQQAMDISNSDNTGHAHDAGQTTSNTYDSRSQNTKTGLLTQATSSSTYNDMSQNANNGFQQGAAQHTTSSSTYNDMTQNANNEFQQGAAQHATSSSSYNDMSQNANAGFQQEAAQHITSSSTYNDISQNANTGFQHYANTGLPQDAAQHTTSSSTYNVMSQNANTGLQQDVAQQVTDRFTHTAVLQNAQTGLAHDTAQYTSSGSTNSGVTTGLTDQNYLTDRKYNRANAQQDLSQFTTSTTQVMYDAPVQFKTGSSSQLSKYVAADSSQQTQNSVIKDTGIKQSTHLGTTGTTDTYKDSSERSAQIKRTDTLPVNSNVNLVIHPSSQNVSSDYIINTETSTYSSTSGRSPTSQTHPTETFDALPKYKSTDMVHNAVAHETIHNGHAKTIQTVDTTVSHKTSHSGRSFDMPNTPSTCRTKECIKVSVSETKLRNYLNNKLTPTAIGIPFDLSTASIGATDAPILNNVQKPGQISHGTTNGNIHSVGHSASHKIQSTTSSTYATQGSAASLLSLLSKTVFDMTSYIENKRFSPTPTIVTDGESRLKDAELVLIQKFMRNILNRVYDLQGTQGKTNFGGSSSSTVTVQNGTKTGVSNSNELLTTMETLYASIPTLHSTDLDTLRYFRHLLERQVRSLGGSGGSSTTYSDVSNSSASKTTRGASGALPTQSTYYTSIHNKANVQQSSKSANLSEIMTFVRQGGNTNSDMVHVSEVNSNIPNLDPSANTLIRKVLNGLSVGDTASKSFGSSASSASSTASASSSFSTGSANIDGTNKLYADAQGPGTYVDASPPTGFDPVALGTAPAIDQISYGMGVDPQTSSLQAGAAYDTRGVFDLRLDAASSKAQGSSSLNDPQMNYVELGTPVYDQVYADTPNGAGAPQPPTQSSGSQSVENSKKQTHSTTTVTVTTGTQQNGVSPPEAYRPRNDWMNAGAEYNNMEAVNELYTTSMGNPSAYDSQTNGQANQNSIMGIPSPVSRDLLNTGSFADAFALDISLPDLLLSSPLPHGKNSQTVTSKTTSTSSKTISKVV